LPRGSFVSRPFSFSSRGKHIIFQQRLAKLPETALWRSALELLIRDALLYSQTKKAPHNAKATYTQDAYNDVIKTGPMLSFICDMTGDDPAYKSQKLILLAQ
jgi:hypothetical protein